jgi:hypothetical protein
MQEVQWFNAVIPHVITARSPERTLFELFARERFLQALIRSDFANSESREVGRQPNETVTNLARSS